ncbi:hypothetical protein KCU90_g76, partial [Aureobasidium melanogenum]
MGSIPDLPQVTIPFLAATAVGARGRACISRHICRLTLILEVAERPDGFHRNVLEILGHLGMSISWAKVRLITIILSQPCHNSAADFVFGQRMANFIFLLLGTKQMTRLRLPYICLAKRLKHMSPREKLATTKTLASPTTSKRPLAESLKSWEPIQYPTPRDAFVYAQGGGVSSNAALSNCVPESQSTSLCRALEKTRYTGKTWIGKRFSSIISHDILGNMTSLLNAGLFWQASDVPK